VLDALNIFLLAPIVGALAIWLLPETKARSVAFIASIACLIVGGGVFADTLIHPGAHLRFEIDIPLISAWGLSYHLGADGLSAAMLALTGLIEVIAVIASHGIRERRRGYFSLLLLLYAGTNGVFIALDSVLFYVAWELMLVPMYVLIGVWGGDQRRYAAMKFVVFTLAGSVLMLVVILALWAKTPVTGTLASVRAEQVMAQGHQASDGQWRLHGLRLIDTQPGTQATKTGIPEHPAVLVPRDFNILHHQLLWKRWAKETLLGVSFATLGFWFLFAAFAVKVPIIGLHTWLPHAHVQAPTAISVILAALLLKLGVYGFLRLSYGIFPTAALDAGVIMAVLGTVAILYAGWVALMQRDLKRLVAYSSVSHMGYCVLGLAALTAASVNGAVVQMVTHGVGSAMLFLLVGVIYDRAHHRRVDGFGGLAKPMPIYAGLALFAALASAGLPGLSGFVGEVLVVLGAVQSDASRFAGHGSDVIRILGLISCLGVIITAAYLLWMVRRVFFGPVTVKEYETLPDVNATELWCLVPLVVLTVVIGVWPQPLIASIAPSADEFVKQLIWVAGAR